MRSLAIFLLAFTAFPSFAHAQGERKPPEVKKIDVGFQTYFRDDFTAHKVGLWTPIYIEVFGGTDGIDPNPRSPAYVEIETVDSEDVGTRIRIPVTVKANDAHTFTGFVKTGRMGGVNDIKVTLHVNGRDQSPRPIEQFSTLDVDAHLYLTLGPKIGNLHAAVRKIDGPANQPENFDPRDRQNLRHVVFEDKVKRLPEVWFGYNCADLIILSTDHREFLLGLNNDPKRLSALAQHRNMPSSLTGVCRRPSGVSRTEPKSSSTPVKLALSAHRR